MGCNKNALSPVAPVRQIGRGLSVSIPYSQESPSNLLGSTSNNILYRFTAPGLAPVSGSAGPFGPAGNSEPIDFSATLPSGAPWLFGQVELDDAPTPSTLGTRRAGPITQRLLPPPDPFPLVMGSIASGIAIGLIHSGTMSLVLPSRSMNEALQTGTTGPGDIRLSPVGAGGFSNSGHQFNRGLHQRLYGERVFGEFRRGPDHRLRLLLCRLKGGLPFRFSNPGGRLLCVALGPTTHAWVQIINSGSLVVGPSFRFTGEYDSRLLRI